MLCKILLIVCLIGLGACAPTIAARAKKPSRSDADARRELDERIRLHPEPSILFVGNSYSFGVPAALKQVAAEHGKTLRIGHSTHSGWTLAKHSTHEPTLRKIRNGNWDIVVLQEFSLTPAKPALLRNHAMFPPLLTLAEEARRAGAIPVLYQTWGRRDRFHTMNPQVRQGYQAASRAAGNLVIIPVGDSWEREFNAGRGNELFMEDGSHPTTTGNRLTAVAFYNALFR